MSVFRNFAGLCFCRVALGMSEGVITVSDVELGWGGSRGGMEG